MAAGNGVRSVWVGQNGLLSTPAVSAVVRERVGADVSYIKLRSSPFTTTTAAGITLVLRPVSLVCGLNTGIKGIRSIYTDSKSQSRWPK